jgi:hypothetical protein
MLEQPPYRRFVMNAKDLEKTVETLSGSLAALTMQVVEQGDLIAGLTQALEELSTSRAEEVTALQGALHGYEDPEDGVPEDETDEQRATRVGLVARVTEIESLVKGRNRSAPVKRNMTDADAVEVLTGKAKDLDHKDAGELVGLTYAQVYSCRLEYTFKHVHKDLKNSGWKNPWTKK